MTNVGSLVREFSWSSELTILLLNWVRLWIISQLIGGEGSEITPNCSHLIDTKGPGVLPVTDNCSSFNKKEWE